MFKGVSQCMPTMGVLYFGLFTSSISLSYPLLPILHFSTAFNTHPYILYLHILFRWYYWCSIILFSFPSFPEFHRIVPLFQTCSTFEFVYDPAWFCVYVFLLDLSSMYERKHVVFVFLSLAYLMSFNCIHLLSNHMSLFLMTE
jgi:hypothetical protein